MVGGTAHELELGPPGPASALGLSSSAAVYGFMEPNRVLVRGTDFGIPGLGVPVPCCAIDMGSCGSHFTSPEPRSYHLRNRDNNSNFLLGLL